MIKMLPSLKGRMHSPKKTLGDHDQADEEDAIYDLYGVCVHQGSSRSFGHYYSYVRGFETEESWYKCNDESISKVSDGLGK
jgi:ubiquitin C-terminal hydrolase